MANNHGGSGSKFVSVNLNKLYGQPSHHNYPPHSGSYGPGVGTNRARPGAHPTTGGGMVVLSRNRPLQKAVPKLSVPPPLNLPSLRKEYEKIDSSGTGGGVSGGAGSGSGSRPTSSGMGWTKPGNIPLQEKEIAIDTQASESLSYTEGTITKATGTYMPPSARYGDNTSSPHHSHLPSIEKAMVLRGEDFPSLKAALPSGPTQKQKEGSSSSSFQKLKQLVSEDSSSTSNDLRNSSRFSAPSHIQSPHRISNGMNENTGQSPRSNSQRPDYSQKQKDDPLPLIWLNPRSDWADDERDTGYGFSSRSNRDHDFPKNEINWEKDFDMPRSSILPHKPANNLPERRGQQITKGPTEVAKPREINFHNREDRESSNNSWRSSIHEDRNTVPQVINNRNNVNVQDNVSNSKYMSSRQQGGQRNWNHVESPRYNQNSTGAKPVFSLNREKSLFSKSERTYIDDPFQKDFSSSVYDERDPFTGNLVGVVKRKKDVVKETDFHDPVRESFEAELERVQKMQEMERQRVVEEQERALEQARREDEERRRVILEEEERRRRMEEEQREAAWRAEQERLEAIQKAEEQKIAREEEKRRMLLEEERRKQAAKQKLLELEAKIAKREAEGKNGVDDEVPGKDSDVSVDSDLDNWEINQRMVERITTSASSDSSAMDRPFDRPQFSSVKPVNPWKRDQFEVGSNSSFLINEQENGHHSPKRYGFPHDQRWNSFGDQESYGRNIESENFYENVEVGWVGPGQNSRANPRSPYAYMNSDYPYARSRYSMKQPRVLPPPVSSIPKSSVRGENELSLSAPSSSLESTARTGNYGGENKIEQNSDIVDVKVDKGETLRCDSQSSLSVSSPPSSPTHLSHDELDDSSVVPAGGDVKETEDGPGEVAADEDEEWGVENHDEMQEQEEYDEDDDGYGEEDEVHEENVNLTQEFEHLNIEEKSGNNVMENLVLGFNEGVEVKIPGDETNENTNTPEVDAVINEPEKPIATSDSSTTNPLPSVTDLPVKLQFGLFSGPSLIPSPVPAIQIGSIQMPLHLHPPVGSSMGHIHTSQPPLFQFGQLRYTSPVSQGILPMAPLVQPNIHHFNHPGSSLPNQFPQENSKKESQPTVPDLPHENWSRGIAPKPEEKGNVKGENDNNLSRNEKDVPLSKAPGPNRGKRPTYPVRNQGPRSFHAYDPSPSNEYRKHRRPIQRTEFRVRENNTDRRQTFTGPNNVDDKFNSKGVGGSRSGYRRHVVSTRSLKRVVPEASQEVPSESRQGKESVRVIPAKTQSEGILKRNVPEEEVDTSDAPMQSGVVRVFKQPGIECPSDEDDFIEVRSKRQMLNDRREQREKEIKAKSRVTKQPRKARPFVQSSSVSTGVNANRNSGSVVGEASNSSGLVNKEPSTDFSTVASQPLAPIGTPSVDTGVQTGTRSHTDKTVQRGSGEDHGSNRVFETEKVVDNAQTSLGDWGNNARIDPQVIPLTQTQLDEAMKPARFNTTHVTSIGDHTTNEPILPSSSILTKGKSISSSSSPINSLLAGEKIQFGAVTSPTILPPSSRVVSHVIGAPGSFRPEINENISKPENDCNNIFFKKDKQISELTDREAEVEAVAVAAIDTDEIVSTRPPVETIQADQQSGSQSKPEENLTVSLPADLSVETPPISLWPPLPSPQTSSTPMLSHFHPPGPTPSHFPFYEMNHPMMSGPVFAFNPHDDSSGPQTQPQKPTGSRNIPPWQNHSGMDSFYGPPAGFTGPFISPPGGIQPPPHMVVYNHYAPVGQFGQVGLSFMGATYIPSGKQPDWKHDPNASVSRSEEDMMGQRGPPPIQHLAPGSPLLPMGSPLTMFDVPPFQTAPDMSRWSHAVPMSMPLQNNQSEAMTGPSQFDQSTFPNRFSEAQVSSTETNRLSFPDELGLVDSSGPSISISTSAPVTVNHISSSTTKTVDVSSGGGGETTNVVFKNHQQGKNMSSQQQYNNNNDNSHPGYGYQRGVSPKNKQMGVQGQGQWGSNRRTGGNFHGRYQSMGQEKGGFQPSTKVKQIYVAKQPSATATGGSSSTVG